ncbi:MAG TPA: VanZ family protein [Pyrinomonadaceae bacterium]|nr:VanZ family protein [Pyrinomonadaceae bacterium]
MTTHKVKVAAVDSPSSLGVWRRRVWRYAPLLLWMLFISYASTGNFSASNTSWLVRPLMLWLVPDIGDETLMRIHITVRKTVHFVEYGILALLAARAFLSSSRMFLRRRWLVFSFLLVACCALLDEYHQSFEAARTGTIYDSLIDMVGGAVALALLVLWRSRRSK